MTEHATLDNNISKFDKKITKADRFIIVVFRLFHGALSSYKSPSQNHGNKAILLCETN